MFKPKSAAKEEPRTDVRNAALYRVVSVVQVDQKLVDVAAGQARPFAEAMRIFDATVRAVPAVFEPDTHVRIKVISDVSYRAGGR